MKNSVSKSSVIIHGIRIDSCDKSSAIERIGYKLKQNNNSLPYTIFTPNAEIIYRSSTDKVLSKLINSSDLNVPDGVGTVWAAKKLGSPLPERIPGIELGESVLELCSKSGARVYLLGGKEGIADKAGEKLTERFPGLLICGTHHGYFDGTDNTELIKKISDASPDFLVVCLGFPRQEEWIIKNRASLPDIKVMMALGGSLDVWSGNVKRAPVFLRTKGLEWLWRILSDPVRIRRAMVIPAFIFLTFKRKRIVLSTFRQNLL